MRNVNDMIYIIYYAKHPYFMGLSKKQLKNKIPKGPFSFKSETLALHNK
jgi:hypothetical protein